MLELQSVAVEVPAESNIIIGQSHFIKTVEDIYEAVVNTVPQARFAVAFNEASGPCLTRADGNDDELKAVAIRNAQAIAAGHIFVLLIRSAYPVNLLNTLQNVPEVCSIYCATANPLQVIVAKSEQGRGIMGVIDGSSPKGIETSQDVETRRQFLRKIGYKR
ncbi:MAG TPA: adenosine-specific kinase [Terriglobales bacterium]|nr:adenosine-specific kinase [Terriglobales bacterium]